MTPNQLPPLSDEQIAALKKGPAQSFLEFARAIESATLAALAQQAQEPVSPDMHRWCAYVGGMVAHWVMSEPNAHVRLGDEQFEAAIAGIIERRLWAMPKRDTTPQPAPPVPAPADEREAFEASMRKKHGWEDRDFKSDSFGYFDGHTATAWLAWQARAALSKPALLAGEVTRKQMVAAVRPLCNTDAVAEKLVDVSMDEYRAILALRPPSDDAAIEEIRRLRAENAALNERLDALRPQAVPMTPDHIWANDGIMSANGIIGFKFDAVIRIVRAVEAHHGITAKAEGA